MVYSEVAPGDVREQEDGEVVIGTGKAPDCAEEGSYKEEFGDE